MRGFCPAVRPLLISVCFKPSHNLQTVRANCHVDMHAHVNPLDAQYEEGPHDEHLSRFFHLLLQP